MCQAFIDIFQGTGSWVIQLCGGFIVPQPNSYSLFLHLHSSQSVTLEAVLYFKRQGHRGLYMASVSPKWIHFYHFKRSFMPICVQSSVMYLSACCCTVLFDSVTPWTAACQASLSFTTSQGLIKLKSIESVMSSNHLILCRPFSFGPQFFPASGSFPVSQYWTFSFSIVLPMNIQDWFPLGLTNLIFLPSKGLTRVFSCTTVWKHQFFTAQPSSFFF